MSKIGYFSHDCRCKSKLIMTVSSVSPSSTAPHYDVAWSVLNPHRTRQHPANWALSGSCLKWWESSTACPLQTLWCLSKIKLFTSSDGNWLGGAFCLLEGVSRWRLKHPSHRHLWLFWRFGLAWAGQKIKGGGSKRMIHRWKVTSIKASCCSVKTSFSCVCLRRPFVTLTVGCGFEKCTALIHIQTSVNCCPAAWQNLCQGQKQRFPFLYKSQGRLKMLKWNKSIHH